MLKKTVSDAGLKIPVFHTYNVIVQLPGFARVRPPPPYPNPHPNPTNLNASQRKKMFEKIQKKIKTKINFFQKKFLQNVTISSMR
jgi:hypothetical protein